MGKQQQSAPQHLEFKGQEIQQQKEDIMADNNSNNSENQEEIKRKNSDSSTLKSVKSASINVIKKGIKIVNPVTNKDRKPKETTTKPQNLSPDMFEAQLGFEPLEKNEKPEITIVRLSDYTQVNHHHPKEIEDHVEVLLPTSTQGQFFAETRSAAFFFPIFTLCQNINFGLCVFHFTNVQIWFSISLKLD